MDRRRTLTIFVGILILMVFRLLLRNSQNVSYSSQQKQNPLQQQRNSNSPQRGRNSNSPQQKHNSNSLRQGRNSHSPKQKHNPHLPQQGRNSNSPQRGRNSNSPKQNHDSHLTQQGRDSQSPQQKHKSHSLRKGRKSHQVFYDCPYSANLDSKKIHLITSVIFYNDPVYNNTIVFQGKKFPTKKQINQRTREVLDTLQWNLNQNFIASIHLLQETKTAVDQMRLLNLRNKDKLFIYGHKSATLTDSLDFAFKCLNEKFVIFVNQDISFDGGWRFVNISAIRDNNIGYVLTRHQSRKCPNKYGTCIPEKNGMGSHDAFAFYSRKKYLQLDKKRLEHATPKNFGMENLLAWWMRDKMRLKLLNPCPLLYLRHEHCVPIRAKKRNRVDAGHFVRIPFSFTLL